MSDKEKLQKQVSILQQYVNEAKEILEKNKKTIEKMEQVLENLKDIAWDRQSKKESSQMYKVLQNDKAHTQVKSDVGNIKVDKDFMEKQTKKHLDNPNLRGMVTTKEMLSYPKVAKNVEAEHNAKTNDYTWKVKANDGNTIVYGSREYKIDGKDTNRLLTTHTKTEENQRMAEVGGRGHPHHSIFNDFDFRKSANKEIITQKGNENQANISNLETNNQPKKPIDFQAKLKEFTENKLQNKNPSKDKERGR
ncbi:hypothetical protein THJ86_001039 [Campylobacter coli]|nr:hypothetical protein [Campylobacter coli]ELZ2420741.1 hypothetical protein [Campylobacter coli]